MDNENHTTENSTTEDRTSKLASAQDPHNRTRTEDNPDGLNVGGLNYDKRIGDPLGALAAQLLADNNGTFIWDTREEIDGRPNENGPSYFQTIYELAAADMKKPNGNPRERFIAAQDHAHEARKGFISFAKWWLDVYGQPLFRLGEPGLGNKITVLTVDPNYEDPHTGKTAVELLREKDRKLIQGQVGAARRRLSCQFDKDEVANILRGAVETELVRELPEPRIVRKLRVAVSGE